MPSEILYSNKLVNALKKKHYGRVSGFRSVKKGGDVCAFCALYVVEQMTVVETALCAWKAHVLAVILHLHISRPLERYLNLLTNPAYKQDSIFLSSVFGHFTTSVWMAGFEPANAALN